MAADCKVRHGAEAWLLLTLQPGERRRRMPCTELPLGQLGRHQMHLAGGQVRWTSPRVLRVPSVTTVLAPLFHAPSRNFKMVFGLTKQDEALLHPIYLLWHIRIALPLQAKTGRFAILATLRCTGRVPYLCGRMRFSPQSVPNGVFGA